MLINSHPVLLLAKLGNTSYPDDPQWNVYDFGSNSSIRIVLNNQTPITHPIHLHGHNFMVVTEGLGVWDGLTMVRPTNPQRRDVQLLRPLGYMVIEIETDNPVSGPNTMSIESY